ncbi:hypothetical protein D3C76_1341630 [compost metagenome]
MIAQAEHDIGHDIDTDRIDVDRGHVGANVAGILQCLGSLQAGAGGEINLLGQLQIADTSIALQVFEDCPVDTIQLYFFHVASIPINHHPQDPGNAGAPPSGASSLAPSASPSLKSIDHRSSGAQLFLLRCCNGLP